MRDSRRILSAAGLLLVGATGACAQGPFVERAYHGLVVDGRYIEPEAYAYFLRGVMAEAEGDTKGALAAYGQAARADSGAAEAWARIAAVRCASNAAEPGAARDAVDRALAIDPHHAGAWAATAQCALGRGDMKAARNAARRAAELDPDADGANALVARTAPADDVGEVAAARESLIALTVTARDPVTAWGSLESWARARDDMALWSRALEALARVAPARRDAVASGAEELAGLGEITAARAVAAAAAEASDEPLSEARHPLGARLAVDEAIARGDNLATRARATRARLGLEEAAARALLGGQHDLARELATALARAEPETQGARLVLAAGAGRGGNLLGVSPDPRGNRSHVSAATWVAFGEALGHAVSRREARRTLAAIDHEAVVPGDELVSRASVDLALWGLIDPDALSADGRVEFALLRAGSPGEALAMPDGRWLDLRHEYLALALTAPGSPRARQLGERFSRIASPDRVAAVALALARLASGAQVDAAAAGALLARDSADPLLVAAALRVAEKTGESGVAQRARAGLAAISPP